MSKIINNILKNYTHHAYILFRSDEVDNIDGCEVMNFDELTIESARYIARQSSLSNADVRTIIINCNRINTNAQNALLKTLEDPRVNVRFILSVPYGAFILDTIKSRCVILNDELPNINHNLNGFFDISAKEKIDTINKVWDTGEVSKFLNTLEVVIHDNVVKNPTVENKNIAMAIYSTKQSLSKLNTKNVLYALAFA